MMHRLLVKLVITALVILGEGVFASESTLRNDGCLEAGGINAQPLLQPPLDGTESLQDPDVQASGAVSQDSDLPLKVQAVFNTHSYGLPDTTPLIPAHHRSRPASTKLNIF